jgi:oligosaccharyltransferase complex subunit gamma
LTPHLQDYFDNHSIKLQLIDLAWSIYFIMLPSLSKLLLLSLLFSSALAAKKPSNDRFTESLSKSYPLKLDDSKYADLTKGNRDYATVVLLTAMDPKFGCAACHEFQPEWDLLARVWQKGDRKGAARTLFAELDFINGRQTFQSLGLQHAPVIYIFPPTTGVNAKSDSSPIRYDFQG